MPLEMCASYPSSLSLSDSPSLIPASAANTSPLRRGQSHSSPTKRTFRRVRFARQICEAEHDPPPTCDDDDDNRDGSTWLSREELGAIREECSNLIARFASKKQQVVTSDKDINGEQQNSNGRDGNDTLEDDIRGLECHLNNSYFTVSALSPRFRARQAVFDVQRLERMQGISHAAFLAKLLHHTTKSSRRAARAMGAHDAAAAKEAMLETP